MTTTAIILSGGKSSRMGTEKGFVKLNGKCLIEHVIECAKKVSEQITVVANTDKYKCFGYKVISDEIKNCGPMGGIYTGLFHSQTETNLVLSCDIPYVNAELLKYLLKRSNNYEVTVPVHNGKIEPLCAVYNKCCTDKLKMFVHKKELKMLHALLLLRINKIEVSTQKFYSEKLFWNVNTKGDLLC